MYLFNDDIIYVMAFSDWLGKVHLLNEKQPKIIIIEKHCSLWHASCFH
ncbi:hypothetical protein PROSTU_03813 [Providencia stuartii ATCC 25827]|uniref:Uncharacterized protein n=1 Tax=Providencia stuartii ATCC 25827 TaxID=471874 RepID=A0AA86YWD7_PROST|nr:hypothetical protein PROSTU_03813 [Providencia stuartii ATCC 25827]